MIENVPGIYNQPSIYNQGGGGAKPVVIPNDVTLYNKLIQTAYVSNASQKININFPKRISNDKIIGILCKINSSTVGDNYSFTSIDNTNSRCWLNFSWSTANEDIIQVSNGGVNSDFVIMSPLLFFNKRFLIELNQRNIINGFTNTTLKVLAPIAYSNIGIGGFAFPDQFGSNAKIELERIYIKNTQGVYLADCRPAVKNGDPGLYDVIGGNFGTADDSSCWTVDEQVVY